MLDNYDECLFTITVIVIVVISSVISCRVILSSAWPRLDHRSTLIYFIVLIIIIQLCD